jgi:hypothetical protein
LIYSLFSQRAIFSWILVFYIKSNGDNLYRDCKVLVIFLSVLWHGPMCIHISNLSFSSLR